MRRDRSEIAGDIEGLQALETPALRNQFMALYRTAAPPRLGRDLLERAVAFRLQAGQYGGLSASTRRRLASLATQLKETGAVRGKSPPSVKPGTRLLRNWHGETHEVTVLEQSFAYRDAHYRSLSQIARRITGAHRSGPAFFGLTQRESR